MINILVPLGGKSTFFDSEEYPFPKPLIEINGKLMIQIVIENFETLQEDKRFIFVINKDDCIKYHLDDVLNLLTEEKCEIIIQQSVDTRGAACSSLLAIEHINNTDKLIICNGDQFIERNLDEVINYFGTLEIDAGVITFPSVHPKWSYVKLDENAEILETAEKRPISKHAIAGFYYFKYGSDFVRSAMKSIEKDNHVNGIFYTAPTLNELILENKYLSVFKIESKHYHSFYSPQKIKEFENSNGSLSG